MPIHTCTCTPVRTDILPHSCTHIDIPAHAHTHTSIYTSRLRIAANQQNGTPQQQQQQQQNHPQQNVNAYGSNKRSRFYGPGDSSADVASPVAAASSPPPITPEVRKLVQEQAQEIESLRSDKDTLQQSVGKLKEDHDRVVNENRILKRAVTIQQ